MKLGEIFIQKMKDEYPYYNDIDLSKMNYVRSNEKITVICKKYKTIHLIRPNDLLGNNSKCSIDNAENKTKYFIKKGKEKHNSYYIYPLNKTKYINATTKIFIKCPKHGLFEQQPYNHLNGQGCYECGYEYLSERYISNYISFVKKANKIHNNYYLYPDKNYMGANKKINIECPKHGIFPQKPGSHLDGRGCRKCSEEKSSGLFNKTLSLRHKNEKKKINSNVYLLKFESKNEVFFKFGIAKNIKKRICDIKYSGGKKYNIEILDEFNINEYDAFFIELYNLERFHKYKPKNYFRGYTECFQIPIMYNENKLKILTNFRKGWLEKILS